MKESYVIRLFVDDKPYGKATTFSEEKAKQFVKTVDKNMTEDGYRRVSYLRVRIDKRHITNIKLGYVKA